jgi:hypothetical protein
VEHILVGSGTRTATRLLLANRGAIRKRGRALALLGVTALLSPMRSVERLATGASVRRTRLLEPPVFILGHWRSGTTLLHNLMTRDPQFGFVSTLQGMFPMMCATGAPLARFLLGLGGPRTRPMDDMAFAPDLPWEEEPCIANVSVHSGLPAWYFPRRAREHFDRYVTFETATPDEIQGWQDACRWTLQKAAYLHGNRRLVAKNPWSTARIPQLLELYPRASFVHIHRHPYEVFQSSLHAFRTGVRMLALDELSDGEACDLIVELYRKLMRPGLEQLALVPSGHLVEIGYDELVREPLATLARIYEALGLPGFTAARPLMAAYLESQSGYRPNRLGADPAHLERVAREWAFAFERWGYERSLDPALASARP